MVASRADWTFLIYRLVTNARRGVEGKSRGSSVFLFHTVAEPGDAFSPLQASIIYRYKLRFNKVGLTL